MYYNFEAGNKAYKLRLNTRNIVLLERQLGCNPLAVFTNASESKLPTVTDMVAILHASLQQYQHNITINDAYDIFDSYIEDGNSTTDFVNVILEIYKASGIIPNSKEADEGNA